MRRLRNLDWHFIITWAIGLLIAFWTIVIVYVSSPWAR